MTEKQMAEAQARLDRSGPRILYGCEYAHDSRSDTGQVCKTHGDEAGVICEDGVKQIVRDLRDALAALRRVRALPRHPMDGGMWYAVDAGDLRAALDGTDA